jgi:hypothetical protein
MVLLPVVQEAMVAGLMWAREEEGEVSILMALPVQVQLPVQGKHM